MVSSCGQRRLRWAHTHFVGFVMRRLTFKMLLSYDVTVIQWLTSRHKNMTTRTLCNTWFLARNVMTPSMTTEIMSTFQAIKFHLKQSYDKQNLTLVVISYETRQRLVSWISYEITTNVRSSIYIAVIQWLTSCHKNRMTPRYITLGYWYVAPWCRRWRPYVYYWNNVNFS